MKTKEQIINETVNYYSKDTSRRALNNVGNCKYITEDGRKCAIGRVLRPSKCKKEFNCTVRKLAEILGLNNLDEALLPSVRGHEVDFWIDLQDIHDCNCNWDDDGLTESGEEEVEKIKECWIEDYN